MILKCVNLDERSQYSKRVLAWCNQRFNEAIGNYEYTFGGIPIVNIFGDLGQLGPIGDMDLHVAPKMTDAPEKLAVETELNKDLKHASTWLNANRLSLNVSKSKLLIFQSKYKNIDYSKTSIKLNGIRLLPNDHVKYLGIFIDNNLSWDYNTIQLSIKLSRTNGILSKLRHFTPLSSLISVYYSLFYSHVTYGCSVWSLT